MAELKLNNGVTIKQARHAVRHSGYRLTVRNGHIYTIKATSAIQPRSAAQLRNWAILSEANRLADADLRLNSRARFWRRRASLLGYKTARGCARAHFLRLLKAGRIPSSHPAYPVRSWIHTYRRRPHIDISAHSVSYHTENDYISPQGTPIRSQMRALQLIL